CIHITVTTCVLRLWIQIQKFQVDMASKAIVSVALFQVESRCHGQYVYLAVPPYAILN
ncbi:hypothetical protein BYT27DRAFT_7201260, partial [Phlegmacium glaucopus]